MPSASFASIKGNALQTFIVIFCIWHMFAVLIYTVPRIATDSFAVLSRTAFLPFVTPYMHTTSQWQLWDLFAPDPLRRVTTYRIDVNRGNGWEELVDMHPGTYPWWQHAVRFKFFGNVLDPFDHARDKVKIRYMQLQCGIFHVPPGTPLRLSYRYYFLPDLTSSQSTTQWQRFIPQWYNVDGLETTCPAPVL